MTVVHNGNRCDAYWVYKNTPGGVLEQIDPANVAGLHVGRLMLAAPGDEKRWSVHCAVPQPAPECVQRKCSGQPLGGTNVAWACSARHCQGGTAAASAQRPRCAR